MGQTWSQVENSIEFGLRNQNGHKVDKASLHNSCKRSLFISLITALIIFVPLSYEMNLAVLFTYRL